MPQQQKQEHTECSQQQEQQHKANRGQTSGARSAGQASTFHPHSKGLIHGTDILPGLSK